jgi:hypothetical protein
MESIQDKLIPVICVIIGFFLGEGSRYFKYRYKIINNKRMITQELKSLLGQINQKRDIIEKAIISLKDKLILPIKSVHFINTGYSKEFSNLYLHISIRKRNYLFIIFETLKTIDELMDNFENNIKWDLEKKIMDKPYDVYENKLKDLKSSMDRIDNLIRDYLNNNCKDILHVNKLDKLDSINYK